jgi:MFS family permease
MPPTPPGSPARVAFRYPNFRYYMTARFLSVTATEMQAVAVAWQIYSLTHRPLDLGLVGLAQFAPGVFLFLLAGHVADRFPRQRILQICYAAFSVCSFSLLALALHGLASVWPIYAVLVGNGVVRSFNGAAGQAFLPLLVAEEHFPNAVAWGASVFQCATILGPTAGGLIYGITGSPIPVYCCSAVTYLAALTLVSMIRLKSLPRSHRAASVAIMLEGLRYIWRNKLILGSISLDLFAVLLGGAVALLPVYARDILNTGAYGLGILRAAPGLGAILMAVTLAHFPLRSRAGFAMLCCVFGFGIFTVVFGLSRKPGSLIGRLGAVWRVRYGECLRASNIGAVVDTRRHARTRQRCHHAVYWRVERSGPIRIRAHRAMVRNHPGGGAGRIRNHRDRLVVVLDVPVPPPGGRTGPCLDRVSLKAFVICQT